MTAGSLEQQQEERLQAKSGARLGWPEWVCLGLYGCLIASMIPYHEPWADEAQAWMLARSLSLWQLFHTYLRYEGQPGLWHSLLWVLIRLHVSYTGMRWFAGAIACAGMAVFVLCSPFPRWLKLSAPFSFFLAYQYAVVARNYVLIPLLLFGVAAVWKRKPIYVGLLLGLLANVASHAAVIAGGFAWAYALEQRRYAIQSEKPANWKRFRLAALVFVVLCAIAVLTAFPTHDVYSAVPRDRTLLDGILGGLVWAMWDPMTASFAGWFLVVWGFHQRGRLDMLIPAGLLLLFCALVYMSFWHAGLMVPVLLAGLWITWPENARPLPFPERNMRWAIAALIVAQIGWTAHAGWYDHFHDFSPDFKTAQFIRPYVEAGDQVAVTSLRDNVPKEFHLVGVAPYFPGKIFMNQETPFWWWSRRDKTDADFFDALNQHPRIVLAVSEIYPAKTADAGKDLSSPYGAARVALIEKHGYHVERIFCAVKPERFTYRESICDFIFLDSRPPAGSQSGH